MTFHDEPLKCRTFELENPRRDCKLLTDRWDTSGMIEDERKNKSRRLL
jgi:hypothetical protein